MDIGDKDGRVSGLDLTQLHLHGTSSGALAPGTAGGVGDDAVAADEVVLKFECQMYKVRQVAQNPSLYRCPDRHNHSW